MLMVRSFGGLLVFVALAGCASGAATDEGPGPATPADPGTASEATETAGSTGDTTTSTGTDGDSSGVATGSTSSGDDGTSSDSTSAADTCGNGELDAFEECDDGNQVDEDDCPGTCLNAACGDGAVQAGVEACDDGNQIDTDSCLNKCVVATCGDAVVQTLVEFCDEGPLNGAYGHCGFDCSAAGPRCGDGVIDAVGSEACDDGNELDGDGCSAACQVECGNPGGGALMAENGTGMNKLYCYDAADTIDTRARKACESHFGVGACCIIPVGYAGLQWGLCDAGGGDGTVHFHPDAHPGGNHCPPLYGVGDVLSKGFCGAVLGNFLD